MKNSNGFKIAFTGKTTSGKDLACSTIQKFLPAKKFSFAHHLREQSSSLFNIDIEKFNDTYKDVKFGDMPDSENFSTFDQMATPRDILIKVGDVARSFDKNIFSNILKNKIKEHFKKSEEAVVITDLRYLNEMEMLKEEDFIIVKLIREGGRQINHNSELEGAKMKSHFIIYNDGTKEQFETTIKKLCTEQDFTKISLDDPISIYCSKN